MDWLCDADILGGCLKPSFPVFSLRQMEKSVIDLNKIEEGTKGKIAAVNSQMVTIVAAFIAQMKVLIY